MKSRWASSLLCLAWSAAASADAKAAAPAPQFNVPTAIPAGGVLPVFGSCFDAGQCNVLRSIAVTDKTSGTAIAGHVEIVSANSFEGWGYFAPDQPLPSGSVLLVKTMGGYPMVQATVSVLASNALDARSVTLGTTLTKERTVLASTCCPNSNLNVKPRCLDTSIVNRAVLAATLTPVTPVATQYLFEVRLFSQSEQPGGTLLDFAPLRSDGRKESPRATFETPDSYCYTVRAKPLLGGEPVDLLDKCLDNNLTELGRVDRTADEVTKWSATCQVSPLSVAGGTPVEDDSLGDDERDDADDDLADDVEQPRVSRQDAGCQLGSSPGLLGAWYALPAVFLRGAKRRRGA